MTASQVEGGGPEIEPTMRAARYSVVVPVFNSEALVGETIARTVAFFERHDLAYELVLVNDGSRDGSWEVLRRAALANPNVVAVNLLRNYGQHTANLCGLRLTTGDYVVTMDDDLQNPPEEIALLINEAAKGRDLVFGRFERKQASRGRKLGSKVIGLLNRRIFGQPRDLVATNFRLLRRDVVDRVAGHQTSYPYITGLALLYSHDRANVTVQHAPRAMGASTYGPVQIARLVLNILFSYSSFPLRLTAMIGVAVSLLSFGLGGFFLVRGVFSTAHVEGWTTLIVLLAFLNGVTIAMLSMLGEYVVRTLNQVSATEQYHVSDIVRAQL